MKLINATTVALVITATFGTPVRAAGFAPWQQSPHQRPAVTTVEKASHSPFAGFAPWLQRSYPPPTEQSLTTPTLALRTGFSPWLQPNS